MLRVNRSVMAVAYGAYLGLIWLSSYYGSLKYFIIGTVVSFTIYVLYHKYKIYTSTIDYAFIERYARWIKTWINKDRSISLQIKLAKGKYINIETKIEDFVRYVDMFYRHNDEITWKSTVTYSGSVYYDVCCLIARFISWCQEQKRNGNVQYKRSSYVKLFSEW